MLPSDPFAAQLQEVDRAIEAFARLGRQQKPASSFHATAPVFQPQLHRHVAHSTYYLPQQAQQQRHQYYAQPSQRTFYTPPSQLQTQGPTPRILQQQQSLYREGQYMRFTGPASPFAAPVAANLGASALQQQNYNQRSSQSTSSNSTNQSRSLSSQSQQAGTKSSSGNSSIFVPMSPASPAHVTFRHSVPGATDHAPAATHSRSLSLASDTGTGTGGYSLFGCQEVASAERSASSGDVRSASFSGPSRGAPTGTPPRLAPIGRPSATGGGSLKSPAATDNNPAFASLHRQRSSATEDGSEEHAFGLHDDDFDSLHSGVPRLSGMNDDGNAWFGIGSYSHFQQPIQRFQQHHQPLQQQIPLSGSAPVSPTTSHDTGFGSGSIGSRGVQDVWSR
ncbi:hypothetical protein PYCC9005_001802 [Savitreella phatthalungensis]